MATPLKVRLRQAAMLNAGLTALLGAGSAIRWYDIQLVQNSKFPAVVVQQVAGNPTYAFNGRLSTGFTRMQFTIYGTGYDGANARQVEAALVSFLDTFDGGGTAGAYNSNQILMEREMGIAETQPATFQMVVDASIFDNQTL